jgi:hypothetical protein
MYSRRDEIFFITIRDWQPVFGIIGNPMSKRALYCVTEKKLRGKQRGVENSRQKSLSDLSPPYAEGAAALMQPCICHTSAAICSLHLVLPS